MFGVRGGPVGADAHSPLAPAPHLNCRPDGPRSAPAGWPRGGGHAAARPAALARTSIPPYTQVTPIEIPIPIAMAGIGRGIPALTHRNPRSERSFLVRIAKSRVRHRCTPTAGAASERQPPKRRPRRPPVDRKARRAERTPPPSRRRLCSHLLVAISHRDHLRTDRSTPQVSC
jgi:hypothetical protein